MKMCVFLLIIFNILLITGCGSSSSTSELKQWNLPRYPNTLNQYQNGVNIDK